MEEFKERRKSPRIDIRWPISIQTDLGPVNGETVNISSDGVSITCEEPIPLEQVLRISIMPPDHQIIEVFGRITWSDLCGIDAENTTVGIGLCFLEISQVDRDYFTQVVTENTEG